MNASEERITVRLATHLLADGWRVISVHPPGGQGPFVIPRKAIDRRIERSSFHPDIVAIRRDGSESRVVIAEVKPTRQELESDIVKLTELAKSRTALLFVLFRCQAFPGGPDDGIDFEKFQALPASRYPIEFIVACGGATFGATESPALRPYKLTEMTFPVT